MNWDDEGIVRPEGEEHSVHIQSVVEKDQGGSAANRRNVDEGKDLLPLRLGVWKGDETSYKALLNGDEIMILLRDLTRELATTSRMWIRGKKDTAFRKMNCRSVRQDAHQVQSRGSFAT